MWYSGRLAPEFNPRYPHTHTHTQKESVRSLFNQSGIFPFLDMKRVFQVASGDGDFKCGHVLS